MNIYIFKSQGVTITIQATDVDNAFCMLSDRIIMLKEMGVVVPDSWDFDLDSVFRIRKL